MRQGDGGGEDEGKREGWGWIRGKERGGEGWVIKKGEGKRGVGIHGQMKNKEINEEKELGKCTVKRGN